MIQCVHIFNGYPETTINEFFSENPQFRYINHTCTVCVNPNNVMQLDILVFYENSPHSMIRPGPPLLPPAIFSAPAALPPTEVPPAAPGALSQWEYTSYRFTIDWEQLHVRLNDWGDEGWEAIWQTKFFGSIYVFFKRKKISDGQQNQTH